MNTIKISPIGTFLREFRKAQKKTLKDVSEKINTSSSFVSQIEKGVRNPSDEVLFKILQKSFHLDSEKAKNIIRKWRVKQYSGDKIPTIKDLKEAEKGHEVKLPEGAAWIDELPLLPYYESITSEFDYEKADAYWPFFVESPEMLKKLFIWRMYDDSMEPEIRQGSILIIDKEIKEPEYHNLALALIGSRATVRYYEKHDDRVKLIPANRQYPVFFGKDVPIFGKVVKMLTDF